jgi:hypothetical protein
VRTYGAAIGFFGVVGLAPLAVSDAFLLDSLVLILIWGSAAAAWNIAGGYAGQISLGHSAFFGLGAYAAAILNSEAGLPIPLCVAAGAAMALVGGLLLALPVAALYPLLLWREVGDPWAFAHAQDRWHRHLSPAGPLGGVWDALTRWVPSGTLERHAIAVNVEDLAFLVVFVGLTVVAWRRFGAAYGVFAIASLVIPLSYPSSRWPLLSLPRFGLAIFPLFLALAALGGRPRVHTAIVACSAVLLGVAVVQWALWQWVA